MDEEPKKPSQEEIDIDVTSTEEMEYIAAKFGCTKGDIIVAIETTNSHLRSKVYPWLVDFTFKNRK